MQDLSSTLPGDPITALVGVSMAGGNMMSDNKLAMTAPGSQPVDPLPPAKEQSDPKITASSGPPVTKGGKDARPPTTYSPGRPAWVKTS
jgi:hypothetical protein